MWRTRIALLLLVSACPAQKERLPAPPSRDKVTDQSPPPCVDEPWDSGPADRMCIEREHLAFPAMTARPGRIRLVFDSPPPGVEHENDDAYYIVDVTPRGQELVA